MSPGQRLAPARVTMTGNPTKIVSRIFTGSSSMLLHSCVIDIVSPAQPDVIRAKMLSVSNANQIDHYLVFAQMLPQQLRGLRVVERNNEQLRVGDNVADIGAHERTDMRHVLLDETAVRTQ